VPNGGFAIGDVQTLGSVTRVVSFADFPNWAALFSSALWLLLPHSSHTISVVYVDFRK
jgi:hypothetical protein